LVCAVGRCEHCSAASSIGALYALAAQLTFDSGRIVAVIDPEFALIVGVIGTLAVVYLGEAFERQYARSTSHGSCRQGSSTRCFPAVMTTPAGGRAAGLHVMFSDLRGFHAVLRNPSRWSA